MDSDRIKSNEDKEHTDRRRAIYGVCFIVFIILMWLLV